jgi:DNA polymerase/3'-5' exonuclease PolX
MKMKLGSFIKRRNQINILGWIGSKHFNRSIRLYSEKEFGYRLSSQGLFDYKNVIPLP